MITREKANIKLLAIMEKRYSQEDHICLKSFIDDVDIFVLRAYEDKIDSHFKALVQELDTNTTLLLKLQAKDQELSQGQNNYNKLWDMYSEAKQEITLQEKDIKSLQNTNATIEQNVFRQHECIQELKLKLQTKDHEIKESNETIENLERANISLQDEINRLEQEIVRLKALCDVKQKQLEQRDGYIAELKADKSCDTCTNRVPHHYDSYEKIQIDKCSLRKQLHFNGSCDGLTCKHYTPKD